MTTQAGRVLTEAHRQALNRFTAATISEMVPLWGLFDVGDIDRTWAGIEPALVALIENRHTLATARAAAYIQAFRLLEGATGEIAVPTPRFDADRVRANLALVGPILTKKAIAANRGQLKETAFVRVAGEVTRHTLDGARETVTQTVKADPRARGWRRVTAGKACDFCQMLAGRDAVYTEDTADFQAHSHCGCVPEPVYD